MQHAFYEKCDRFGNQRRIPCFGIVDGKHWACEHPPKSGSLNYNYKAFFSFNSLFVCDAEMRIIYVQICTHGVNSDAQMFQNGPLPELLKNAAGLVGLQILPDGKTVMPAFILADNGFGQSKQVMQPYRQARLTTENIRFNEHISATRVKIENLFGVMTSKFQVFGRALRLSPNNSRALIVACSVVHNITVGPLVVADDDMDYPIVIDPYKTAEEQRTALKNFVLNP
uniref:DDE Tnp4 domain-containing protein n=1 Tax=Caenorhabditis japonica TaxID=281687 RepID=A0A2Q4SX13_CAEJA